MKTKCTFGFDDTAVRTMESREYIAHLLRAYRKQKHRYEFKRLGTGFYSVRSRGFDSAVATITTR